MTYSSPATWGIIAILAVGTYLIRFSFLGLIGRRKLPPMVERHLRFTPVAVLPGLVAPLLIWPAATQGETDPVRMAAVLVTLVVGVWTRHVILSLILGGGVFYLLPLTGA